MLQIGIEDKYPSVSSIVNQILRGVQVISDKKNQYAEDSETNTSVNDVRAKLEYIYVSLQGWNARYDYALWERLENNFNDIWPELECYLYLCIEYDLYAELKKIFIELRNFLHTTGRTRERLYFAAWLFKRARQLEEEEIELFALSTIVWSYTCTGYYQNITKAEQLWCFLMNRILKRDTYSQPIGSEFNIIVQDSTEGAIYPELLLEAYESGVRIFIRQYELDKAWLWTSKSNELINRLFQEHLISSRLRIRCQTAQKYHRGIILYLKKDFDSARYTFENVYKNAERIGWERVQRGVQSWLATVAKDQNRLEDCGRILAKIGVSDTISKKTISQHSIHEQLRDAFCHLIKADLESKRGQIDAKQTHQEVADRILEEHSGSNDLHDVEFKSHYLLTPRSN